MTLPSSGCNEFCIFSNIVSQRSQWDGSCAAWKGLASGSAMERSPCSLGAAQQLLFLIQELGWWDGGGGDVAPEQW